MSRRPDWSKPATRTLQECVLGWEDAARIDAAIMLYAETGQGAIYRLPDDHAVTVRLRVGVYRVVMSLVESEETVRVIRVYRAAAR